VCESLICCKKVSFGMASRFFRKTMRGLLTGFEQEPVVVFSIALSVFSVGVAIFGPPMLRRMGYNLDTALNDDVSYAPKKD
jgi:hypothetical protein